MYTLKINVVQRNVLSTVTLTRVIRVSTWHTCRHVVVELQHLRRGLFSITGRDRNRVATLLLTCCPMAKNTFTSAIAIAVGGTDSVLYSKTFDGGVVAAAFLRNLKQ